MHESINEYGTDALEKTIFFSIPKIRDADSDLHASIYIFIRYINIACHVTMIRTSHVEHVLYLFDVRVWD